MIHGLTLPDICRRPASTTRQPPDQRWNRIAMRRADRLFDIIQSLRQRSLTRARDLAEELEVSERTIYRDIADLIASGVPIEGEAGVGYVMKAGFDLPPLMFDEAEIEALVLGARIVETSVDSELARAARRAIGKVESVIPEALRDYMSKTALIAPRDRFMEPIRFEIGDLRRALREQQKVHFAYTDGAGDISERTVRPSRSASPDAISKRAPAAARRDSMADCAKAGPR